LPPEHRASPGPAPRRALVAFEHVTFDLDGTLIDSRADLAGAVNHVLRSVGLPEIAPGTLYGYVGDGARMLVQRVLGAAHRDRVDEALPLFMEYYGAHLLDATVPYAGVVDMLTALAERDVTLSVLTNKPEAMSRAILDGLGLLSRFAAVAGGDSLPARKPDPGGVDYLIATTHTSRERTLLVGDSLIDMKTANAARVAFCGVAWGLRCADLVAARVERMIDRPNQLVQMVELGHA
jgi:phosphoglycolate phosphatase